MLFDELEHRLNELEHRVTKLDTKIGNTKLATGIRKIQIKNEDDPEAGQRFIKWLGRVMTEKIPGTDVTYGADIEVIKNNTRSAFRNELTEKQYAEFESWGVDPTDIKEIENSPGQI